jgi:hypothetical protein
MAHFHREAKVQESGAMTEDEKSHEAVREQTAKIMKAAAAIFGGREGLAGYLGVAPYLVAEWTAGISDAPYQIVNKAVDAIVEAKTASKPTTL